MAADNVIKVWDLRNHRCIQTITDLDWPSQEDAHPCVMMYDTARSASPVCLSVRYAVFGMMEGTDVHQQQSKPKVGGIYRICHLLAHACPTPSPGVTCPVCFEGCLART